MSYNEKPSRARAHATARTRLNVLIACEESQAECAAFRALGHHAFSCDIQPCRPGANPYWHIQADVTPLLTGDTVFNVQAEVTPLLAGDTAFNVQARFLQCVDHWDLIIAHPPCTYLCKVGSMHMWKDGQIVQERYQKMLEAREFFFKCLAAQAKYVAVENPIPMAMARLPRPSFYIQPSWFGVKYTKKTLYWTKNLPPILPKVEYPNPKCFVTASRGKYRSRTFPQVAQAIAEQWSAYILDEYAREF